MRSLPGIRVSQPGSGAEGETFILRGLLGNSYMKIMLNGNTIKPSIVRGMPMGAQLPIRQAERIEVIYGPTAVMYGADAAIGVINIITKESERPIYVQANLSVGSNAYTNIDVMFGGKLGANKHILRYSVYGSNTFMNNRQIFYDLDSLYNPSNYTPNPGVDTNYVNNPNYYGTAFSPDIAKTPHLSRLLGFNLHYRDLSFSIQDMYRRDHSAIGLSPLAVSYADQGTSIGENIIKANLAFKKNYKKWGLKTHLNYLRYERDPNSSNLFVEDKLSRVINQLSSNLLEPAIRDSIRMLAQEVIFSSVRYSYALSNDIKLEQLFYINPTNYLGITVGGSANVTVGLSHIDYLSEDYDQGGVLSYNSSNIDPSFFIPESLFLAMFFEIVGRSNRSLCSNGF
jgi:outer membrane receptor protein involved in Fe transport